MTKQITFATRLSALARWQTQQVIRSLQVLWSDLTCEEVFITTKGDRTLDKPLPELGGKGLFTAELERALLNGQVDAAVHSLKDLPTEDTPGLIVGVIPPRADARDAWVCPSGYHLADLPVGALVGTSSIRRRAQLLVQRSDLRVEPIRGNVDTRIRKVREGQFAAIILAAAGLTRLGLQEHITHYLPFDVMLPAPGQGALAIQCRADDSQTLALLQAIDHPPTHKAVTAERAFLAALGGGCSLPVGALASIMGESIQLQGAVAAPDSDHILRFSANGEEPHRLGKELARQALAEGAADLLSGIAAS